MPGGRLRPTSARAVPQYSRVVWDVVGEIVPRIERTGIDEGYLDLGTVASDFTRARAVASAVQTAVRATTSLTCSLGVGTSKVVCKIASDRRKPGGITVVPPGSEARFLAPLAVRLLPGVGPRAEERLRAAGIETIGGARRARRRRPEGAHPGVARPAAARPGARDRPARPRARGRARVRVLRGHVRARRERPRGPARRGATSRVPRVRASAQLRSLRTNRDGEAPVRRLLDSHALDDAPRRRRRGRGHRRGRLRAPRPRASATDPGRCASSASASPGSRRSASSRSRTPRPALARLDPS